MELSWEFRKRWTKQSCYCLVLRIVLLNAGEILFRYHPQRSFKRLFRMKKLNQLRIRKAEYSALSNHSRLIGLLKVFKEHTWNWIKTKADITPKNGARYFEEIWKTRIKLTLQIGTFHSSELTGLASQFWRMESAFGLPLGYPRPKFQGEKGGNDGEGKFVCFHFVV